MAIRDLVFDTGRNVLYGSIPSNAPAHANTVVSINPLTGAIVNEITTGNNPGALALSRDGHYLYIGLDGSSTIRRFDLQSQTTAFEFSPTIVPNGVPLQAGQIAVLPGQPESIAVVLLANFSHIGVVIFDNDVPRPNRTSQAQPNNVIEFGNDPTLCMAKTP